MYGHAWVHKHLDGLPEAEWETPDVCGYWSVKDIMAHLASYELILAEVLQSCVDPGPTPNLDEYVRLQGGDAYNAEQVTRRKTKSPEEILAEYDAAYERVNSYITRIPEGDLRQPGTIPWYGKEYSLDDLIVYMYYGHKREHCAQIAVFQDTLNKKLPA